MKKEPSKNSQECIYNIIPKLDQVKLVVNY